MVIVQDLIKTYMARYETDFDGAIKIMIEDLQEALNDDDLRQELS